MHSRIRGQPHGKDAMDDYTFVREVWAQRRNRQIEQDLRSNRA